MRKFDYLAGNSRGIEERIEMLWRLEEEERQEWRSSSKGLRFWSTEVEGWSGSK